MNQKWRWNQKWRIAVGLLLAGFLLVWLAPVALAQRCEGLRVEGMVLDPDGAAIPGASVRARNGDAAVTDAKGHYALPCVAARSARVTATANGFAPETATVKKHDGGPEHFDFHLKLARVNSSVQVNGGEGANLETNDGTHTLTAQQIQQLAGDPDDLRRELEALAAANGGAPGAARITVNGFQNSSTIPPKSSIARIVTTPDMYSSQYSNPPYDGGHIEIFTKPGAPAIHGAVFYTDSDGSFNATDPFSTIATPAGKRRYGFELSGPIVKTKSDYALSLEKRDIDEFNVVNAITLGANGNPAPLHQTVSAPQRLWIASARADWQVSANDAVTLSFSAHTIDLANQGIGGLTTKEAGYNSTQSEYDLRFSNQQTLSPNLLHETRVGFTWKDNAQAPLSTAPALQVAGFFQGGGNTAQHRNDRERDLEIDDDFLYSHGRNIWKLGAQSMGIFLHNLDPDTFNGAYTFGGGTAPALDASGNSTGGMTTISALEQYRRALLGLPGGAPTTYSITTGTALVPLTQWQLALYVEDTFKMNKRLTLSGGLRYALQTTPLTYGNFAPRAGLAWALDRHAKTILHLRAGLFSVVVPADMIAEAYRLNGVRQRETIVYSPSFTAPLTPTAQSLAVSTVRRLPASLAQRASFQSDIAIEHQFPHQWHAQVQFISGEIWGMFRSRNINAPMVASGIGPADPMTALKAPRPLAPNKNIDRFEATGHFGGNVFFLSFGQHSLKRFGFSLGYLYFNLKSDTPDNSGFVQSAYSNQGERAWANQPRQRLFFTGNLNLPEKFALSSEMDAEIGAPYTVTTGTDNNGDGVFNDRPSYASAPGPGVAATPFGLLTANAVNGDVPRNVGIMPSVFHLDMDLRRAWKIGPHAIKSERTLTLNARAANLFNHTNATAVGTVVGSPTLGRAVAAESARRLELGVRFSF